MTPRAAALYVCSHAHTVAWRDDAQVAGLHACRLYGHPGVLISIERQAVQR